MKYIVHSILALGLTSLIACEPITPTPRPDYAIRVVPEPSGSIAVPPACMSWNEAVVEPLDNQPLPQYGCATQRNLAALVENPNDLVVGRDLGDQRAVTAVGAMRRYDNNQTRGLLIPVAETSSVGATTAPTGTSAMTGEITTPSAGGGGGASSSSP